MKDRNFQNAAGLTRRGVVAGGAALAALPFLGAGRAIAQTPSPRQSVTGAGSAVLSSYKKAIQAMLALPPEDPRNWYRQAMVHMLDCPHANWWFLPWHRGYLWHFESICREMSGDPTFSLPFWDWSDKAEVPAAFFEDVLNPTSGAFAENGQALREKFGGAIDAYFAGLSSAQKAQLTLRSTPDSNALCMQILGAVPSRTDARGVTAESPNMPVSAQREVALDNVLLALRPQSFETFASREAKNHHEEIGKDSLERGPHDNVHGGINALMGAFMAPVDPIFWLHHCNLDRLWTLWTSKETKAGRTGLPANIQPWRDEPFLFFADAQGQALAKTAGDYIDNTVLGVTYGPGKADEIVASAPIQVADASDFKAFPGEQGAKQLRVDHEVSLTAEIAASVFARAQASAATNERPALMAYLTVSTPSLARMSALRVFINCPYLSADTPITDPHYIGRIEFFGADHGMMHQGQDIIYALPLNRAVAGLTSRRRDTAGIKVQIIAECKDKTRKVLDGAVKALEIKTV